MATVVHGPSFGAELNALLQGIGMIQDKLISNRYKSKVAEYLGGYEKDIEKGKGVSYTTDMPTDFVPVGGEREYGMAGQYREPSMQPVGSQPVQTTVPIPYTQEEKQQKQYALIRALKGAGAGVPASMRMDTSGLFPGQRASGLTFEERMALKKAGSKPTIKTIKDKYGHYGTLINGQLVYNEKNPQSTKKYTHPKFVMTGQRSMSQTDLANLLMKGEIPSPEDVMPPEDYWGDTKKKALTIEKASEYLKRAKGNKAKARAMAKKDGYEF